MYCLNYLIIAINSIAVVPVKQVSSTYKQYIGKIQTVGSSAIIKLFYSFKQITLSKVENLIAGTVCSKYRSLKHATSFSVILMLHREQFRGP